MVDSGGNCNRTGAEHRRLHTAAHATPRVAAVLLLFQMSDHKRIYIGGLTPDISQDDVSSRFRPFGQVLSCEIIKAKGPAADSNSCRGFAYVTLQPKDEVSLARMLSLVRFSCLAAASLAGAGVLLLPPLLLPSLLACKPHKLCDVTKKLWNSLPPFCCHALPAVQRLQVAGPEAAC